MWSLVTLAMLRCCVPYVLLRFPPSLVLGLQILCHQNDWLPIFLWLPDRTEDRSGLVGKIITFWQRIGSRVFECGGNDGFGGFLRLNSILEKNSKTSFRDRWDRSLQTERTGPLRYTLEHFVTLASQTYLCALVAACTPPHTMHKPHTHTQTLLPMSSWVFQRCMMGGMHH